jgi:ABC-type Fe3+ transport system substrate-binding protein
MRNVTFSRRDVLKSSVGLAATTFATPLKAAAPEPSAITPALVDAARKEGKLAFYTAMDLPVAERLAKTFEAKFPGIAVRVERSGAERVFQRIGQEQDSGIHAVDVVNSADASHFIVWKRNGWLAPYLPEEVAKYFPADYFDPDGLYATTRVWLSSLGYNTALVKKLALGERAIMADGNDYNLIQLKESGQPVEVVYPAEGTPLVTGPSGVFKSAPNPNAGRLFQNWMHSLDGQQVLVDFAAQHSVHAQIKEKPGRKRLSEIKLMKDDPAGVERASEDIKARYSKIFGI